MAAPKTANISITIGETDINIPHDCFAGVTITRTANDVSDSFTLDLLDDAAYTVEKQLLYGDNYIMFTYIDDNMKDTLVLGGYVYSISDAFYEDRVMISLKGFVSSSIKDKYDKYSFSWNVVPKFDWWDVLGDSYADTVDENNSSDDWDSQLGQWLYKQLKRSSVGWKALFTWNWEALSDYKEVINALFDKDRFSIDSSGNYYAQRYKRSAYYAADEEEVMKGSISHDKNRDNISKATGSFTIPIKPNKLIKLICCGGKYSDLLEKNYEDYEGTAFYEDDINEAEWYFIKKWYEKLGKFSGLGYGTFDCDYELDFSEDQFIQTNQSFLEFMYKNILSKSVQTKKDKKNKDKKAVYANFYLSFSEGNGKNKGSVKLSRIDASAQPSNAPQYVYYGKPDNESNKGKLVAVSPTLNILTSMIAGAVDDNADISSKSLNGSDLAVEVTVSASKKDTNSRYNVHWGVVKNVPVMSYTANKKNAVRDIASSFEDAAQLSYECSATIEGYNNLKPQDYIEIIMVPKNSEGVPTYHHTSGLYFILSVENKIRDGKFHTELKLIKNIQNMGNTAKKSQIVDEAELTYKYTVKSKKSNGTPPGVLRTDQGLIGIQMSGMNGNVMY